MPGEFVRLAQGTLVYGKKNLLNTQLSVLNIIKNLAKFKTIRTEELVLKIALKNKIEEAKSNLLLLEKLLPKAAGKNGQQEEIKEVDEEHEKKRHTLEEELAEIRRKLEQLK